MNAQTIDHNTLSRLVEAGVVSAAHVIGQADGWSILIKYGMLERPLAASRSKQLRTFKKFETLVSYLKEIGINQFDVDASQYDPSTIKTYARPDRAEAMKNAHEAAAYDNWFRSQVGQALKDANDPNTVWIPHEEIKADMQRQRASILERIDRTE